MITDWLRAVVARTLARPPLVALQAHAERQQRLGQRVTRTLRTVEDTTEDVHALQRRLAALQREQRRLEQDDDG